MAGNLYPMECGDLRRGNHNLNPSPLTNPLKVSWVTPPCADLGRPVVTNPIILSDRVVEAFQKGVRKGFFLAELCFGPFLLAKVMDNAGKVAAAIRFRPKLRNR